MAQTNNHAPIALHVFECGTPGLFDVFWGEGWRNWSRVSIANAPPAKPVFTHVSGFGLPWHVRIAVTKHLKLV